MTTTTIAEPTAAWTDKVYSGGWRPGMGGVQNVIEPATGEVLGSVGVAAPEDVVRAARAARAAQGDWAKAPVRERAEVFRRAAAVFERDAESIASLLAQETGSLLAKGRHEVRQAIDILYCAAGMPLQPQGHVLPQMSGRFNFARRVPLGVVGVISPFNFPLILSLRSVAPALAAGNAVVLKPDLQTPVAGGMVIARAFEEAGLPLNTLHVLPGGAAIGEAMCVDPNIAMIAFTGSTQAGRKVGESCGRHLKKVALELGGKNPLIVLEDAEIDVAVSNAAWGSYFHQGQICMATGLILVHRSILAPFIEKLAAKAEGLRVGNPATEDVALGPVISRKQRDRVDEIVKKSVAQGAKLKAGGTYEDLFYKATILSEVLPGMSAFEEEIFGPVAVVASFDSDEQAVELANRSQYGLAAGVISADGLRALALGQQLKTGILHINDQTIADDVVNPFGGQGASGNGTSMGGPADWEEYTQWQWITLKSSATHYPY